MTADSHRPRPEHKMADLLLVQGEDVPHFQE